MPLRVIDFSEEPAKLYVRNLLLYVLRAEKETVKVPISEIAVIVVSHPQVTFSQSVLSELCLAGGVFIACDQKHVPAGILLPVAANYAQTERFAQQAKASEPTKKQIWKQIIKAKIRMQGMVLERLRNDDAGLIEMAKKVRSGDSGYHEAQAARRYWVKLFDNPKFIRDRDANDQNRLLNYGYAVLRAVVARSICAAGLHPSIGVHHHNRYDAFCLASDLMEPFRPLVDLSVADVVQEFGELAPLDKEVKAYLLSTFLRKYHADNEARTLFDITFRTASSLVNIFSGENKKMFIPQIDIEKSLDGREPKKPDDSEGSDKAG